MSDVFVSYSRRDAEFVRRLADSVAGAGKELWVDTEGIADAEVFPEAIKRAIEQSDSFVFVITPPAVASSFCEQEVDYARELQKRIVPVLREPVPDEQLPAEIRERNWIPFTEGDDFDVSLGRLLGALDRDLEHVREHTRWLVKALEWDAEGRERSFLLRGSELTAAEAWLAAAPEDADPAPTPVQREYLLASRQAATRRQRTFAGASLAVAAVAIGLLIFALISRSQAQSQKTAAQAQALAAESQAQLGTDPEASVLLAARAVRTHATPQTMFALRAALDTSPLQRTLPTLPRVACPIGANQAAVSPDGKLAVEASCMGRVVLASLANGAQLRTVKPRVPMTGAVAYDPSGRLIALGTVGGVVLAEPGSLAVRARLPTGFPVDEVAFSASGGELAAVGPSRAYVWSLPSRRVQARTEGYGFQGRPGPGTSLAFTPDGRELLVGAEGSREQRTGVQGNGIDVFDAAGGRLVRHVQTHVASGPAYGTESEQPQLALSPDGTLLAASYSTRAGLANVVAIYSTRSWRQLFSLTSLTNVSVGSLAFSPDGRELAVGAADGTAGVWSLVTRSQVLAYDGQTADIASMQFTPDGGGVLTASNDGTVRLWRSHGSELALLRVGGVPNSLGDLVVEHGRLTVGDAVIRSGAPAEQLQRFSLPGGQLLETEPAPPGDVVAVDEHDTAALITRHQILARRRAPRPQPLVVWSVSRRAPVQTLPPMLFEAATFSPGDSRLAVAMGLGPSGPSSGTGKPMVIPVGAGRRVHLQVGSDPCGQYGLNFSWSADGRRVAGYAFCGVVDVWDAASGRLLRQVSEGSEISQAVLSPDGTRLLIAAWDSRATIWNVASGKPVATLVGHTRGVVGPRFTPDGRFVLTGSVDGTARLWNAGTGHVMRIFHVSGPAADPVFSSDGKLVAVGDGEGNVRIWETCPACENAKALLALAAPHEHDRLSTLERTIARQTP